MVPSGVHVVQGIPPLHWVLAVHAAPGARRPQLPPTQLSPLQQSASWEQVPCAAAQQAPAVHVVPLQQSCWPAQAAPAAAHIWQVPSLQMFEQQSDASVHASPSPEQSPHFPA